MASGGSRPAKRKRMGAPLSQSAQNMLRRKAIPRADVLQFRTGFTNVTKVSDFHKSYIEQVKNVLPHDFFPDPATPRPKEWTPLASPQSRGNFDVTDLIIPSPFERVQSAIESALGGWDRETGKGEVLKSAGSRKRKRKRNDDPRGAKRRGPVQNLKNAKYIKYAQSCTVPNYERMLRPWAKLQEHRKKMKVVKVKKEMNTLTDKVIDFRLQNILREKGHAPVPPDSIVLRVSVFHHQRAVNKFTRSHEYLILGEQTLADLRDVIECLSDKIMLGPNIKNGFFFIEDTFYDDLRHEDAIRLSQPVCDWVREDDRWFQRGLNRYEQEDMSKQIKNLKIRLGAHYLYRHQGDCDHMIIFSDLRALQPEDIKNLNAYPHMIFQQIARRQKCGVCEIYPAKYVTYGDPLTSSNPFFFCEKCYHPFHFDRDGSLLYDNFHVYPYIHD